MGDASGASGQITVCDDDEEAARDMVFELSRLGFESSVVDQDDVVASVLENPPDAVSLDLSLRGGVEDGLKIIHDLSKAALPGVFLAAVTSHADREMDAIEAGAHGVIIKQRVRHDALKLALALRTMRIEREHGQAMVLYERLVQSNVSALTALLEASDDEFLEKGGMGRARKLIREMMSSQFSDDWESSIMSALEVQMANGHDVNERTVRLLWAGAARAICAKEARDLRPILKSLDATGKDSTVRWMK